MSRGVPTDAAVVVIDDDESRRYTKSRVLRGAGFEVFEASSGAEGLAAIHAHQPRLVIVDVGLPDMSGHDVCRRLRGEPGAASLALLQVSATFVTEADTVASLESGADASLVEPIEPQVLVATARALLRARQAEDAMREALAREQAARAAAEDANRVKDDFLAVLSHELRSPLGAILTWVTLLRSGNVGAVRQERGLEAIERNARVQTKLIEDLLDVTRIISGKSILDMALVEIGPVVDGAIESVRGAAEAKGVRLHADLDPTVGPLLADATRLQQVIWNLLSNAVKFTPRGGSVRLEVSGTGSQAMIRVADSGRGISPQFLPHVFERFRQADASTTRAEGGLGLGLAIVRHIVEQHGGQVRADSPGEGRGATFTVQLPLPAVPAIAARGVGPRKGRATVSALDRLDSVRLLVVDDERDAREAVVAVLEACGARVVAVGSAQSALDALGAERFDAVISDIGMPFEDGYSLIRRLRERGAAAGGGVPTLALTAYANTGEVQRILAAGFDASLTKPVEAKDLLAEVARLVRPAAHAMSARPLEP